MKSRAFTRTRRALRTWVLLTALLPSAPAQEFRGLWVDAFHPGFRSRSEVTRLIADARAGHFNALLVEIRKRGDAYYDSRYEPKAGEVSPPSFDPLADLIAQAHYTNNGPRLEVHAFQDRSVRVVAEPHILEPHHTGATRQWPGIRRVADRRFGFQNLHHTAERDERALNRRRQPAETTERSVQHANVRDEHKQLTHAEPTGQNALAADPNHRHRAGCGD